jgi:serine/threonine protein kinase
MSPEGLNQNVYGDKTDTWAFGILIYELIHGETPFCHCQTELALKNAVCHPIPEHKFSRNIPYPLRQLINSLL